MSTIPVPSTAVTGNFLTSAMWNSQVRDAVTFLTNPPRFIGVCTVIPQNVASGVEQLIPFDSEDVDSEGGHSTTVNNTRYVVQVPGTYLVTGHLAWVSNVTGMRQLDIKLNGTFAPGGRVTSGGPTNSVSMALSNSVHLQLVAGDYLELAGQQFSGNPLSMSGSVAYNPRLTLHWVSN